MPAASNLLSITAEAALQKLRAGEALRGYRIAGPLDLAALTMEHCWVEDMRGSGGYSFQQPVVLRQTHFARAAFVFAYFLQGLTMQGCTFDGYLDFQAGGHNKPGYPVRLLGNTFHGFVNFFDCWYEADVQLEGNNFRQGTNLLGAPHGIPVTFDVPPQISGNLGRLDHDDEGPAQPG
ncbi:hypothetical protein [Hymenobacter edaphi]|uniref:Right-handed parallel beta-helix repeat-containing protein n=1 Tax=Hymenobacter edaphi TaxID=2211146 RepID=A0A328BGT7_9BACT|nr:hypothetical protein [Hymenobacter edaphi]RAK66722.1 hypothetical protein DLM85_10925 [Hymenobacter edaphi]